MTDPFHEGERAVQSRVGIRARMATIPDHVFVGEMPDQHRTFFHALPFVVLGALDSSGQPWATALAGATGFIDSPTARTLVIGARGDTGDPALASLAIDSPIGVLGIEPHTRRRNRANGIVHGLDTGSIEIHVLESFGNCPKYIQARRPTFDGDHTAGEAAQHSDGLDDPARALIRAADTFFLASVHPEIGVDASHRGGRPGFVAVEDDVLVVPDFTGNFYFNTLGNFVIDPRAGLLFLDFDTGELLHLAATVEIIWDGPEVDAFAGAKRLVRFTVHAMVRRPGALALRWGAAEPSPHVAATGIW